MRVGAIAALAGAMLLPGCATAIRGSSEVVVFDSVPAGAEMRSVVLNPCAEEGSCPQTDDRLLVDRSQPDGPACVTPCSISIPRKQELIVTFSKAGYAPQSIELRSKLTTQGGALAVAGAAVSITGFVVDSVNCAGCDHYPNPLKVTLQPISARR
jgi:hypothetical protein